MGTSVNEPAISVEGTSAHDLDGAGGSEWLEADGLGGYAMGTVGGPATCRYHGLLCVAARPPTGRVMLVNATTETFYDDVGAHPLDAHFYPGVVSPDGHTRIERFVPAPWPTWTYDVGEGQLVREVIALRERAMTILRWTYVARHKGARASEGAQHLALVVRPLLSGRDSHALHRENGTLDPRADVGEDWVEVTPYRGAIPGVRMIHEGLFGAAPDWYRSFQYPIERERGLDCEEDLFSPGELRFDLRRGPALLALCAAQGARIAAAELPRLVAEERARRASRRVVTTTTSVAAADPVVERLHAAAEAFVIHAGEGGVPARSTVIAGYPWFTDWGRDTFISARGLSLAFGRAFERELLLAWEPFLSGGMIPNRFPEETVGESDGLGGAAYNAVDASLWYALRSARHLNATAGSKLASYEASDSSARARLTTAVRRVIEGYLAGTRHGIHIDEDGLVHAADAGQQLTWMDAKVGDWVVTPRAGKPVEVQALWIAALEASTKLFATDDGHLAAELAERAAWARSSFAARFWCEARGWLYDVIDGPTRDDTLRPNQLYALGLVKPLVEPDRARRALEAVERELLVPVGLRSRARGPGYRGKMVGNPTERDGAYHEGTVWAFLLGIYADACQRVRGKVPPAILAGVLEHMEREGLGQIAEVFDGDAPHAPRGCPAQAWSVAEALRVRLGAIAED